MVLQHVQSKPIKQNDYEKKSSLPSTTARGRNSGATKSSMRNKDRATTLNVRDVNLDNLKLMEPAWRTKKFDKITVVPDDQQASAQLEDRNGTPCDRKLTLQDFIVAGIGARLSSKWRKRIGMHTSAYIVVPKPARREEEPLAVVAEELPANEDSSEVDYSETLEDDFVVISMN